MGIKDLLKSPDRRKVEKLITELRIQLISLEESQKEHLNPELRSYLKGQKDQLEQILWDLEELFDIPHFRENIKEEDSNVEFFGRHSREEIARYFR